MVDVEARLQRTADAIRAAAAETPLPNGLDELPRRRAGRRLLAAAAVVALAGGGTFTIVQLTDSEPTPPATQPRPSAETLDRFVIEGLVIDEASERADGTSEIWMNSATELHDSALPAASIITGETASPDMSDWQLIGQRATVVGQAVDVRTLNGDPIGVSWTTRRGEVVTLVAEGVELADFQALLNRVRPLTEQEWEELLDRLESGVETPLTAEAVLPTESTSSTVPSTTIAAEASSTPVPWFEIELDGAVAGDVIDEESSVTPTAGSGRELYVAWMASGGLEKGFIFLREIFNPSSLEPNTDEGYASIEMPEGKAWLRPLGGTADGAPGSLEIFWARPDGAVWLFQSSGLTAPKFAELVRKAEPGSGLPVVIPDGPLRMVGTGTQQVGRLRRQHYEVDGSTITLTSRNDLGALQDLPTASAIDPITIAGTAGARIAWRDGRVSLLWPASGRWWMGVEIPADLAARAEEIAASIESPGASDGLQLSCEATDLSDLNVAGEPSETRDYPEYKWWTRDGCLVRIDHIADYPGTDHCGFESARIMTTGTPVGARFSGDRERSTYIRDPEDVFGLASELDLDAELPATARDTGYRSVDGEQLWVDPEDPSRIYVVNGDRAERWPQGEPPACF